MDNVYASGVLGAMKRLGSRHVSTLWSDYNGPSKVHFYDRDRRERYALVFGVKDARAIDLRTGAVLPVIPRGVITPGLGPSDFRYLQTRYNGAVQFLGTLDGNEWLENWDPDPHYGTTVGASNTPLTNFVVGPWGGSAWNTATHTQEPAFKVARFDASPLGGLGSALRRAIGVGPKNVSKDWQFFSVAVLAPGTTDEFGIAIKSGTTIKGEVRFSLAPGFNVFTSPVAVGVPKAHTYSSVKVYGQIGGVKGPWNVITVGFKFPGEAGLGALSWLVTLPWVPGGLANKTVYLAAARPISAGLTPTLIDEEDIETGYHLIPERHIRATTIEDTTFVVNDTVVASMNPSLVVPGTNPSHQAFIWVRSTNYDTSYWVRIKVGTHILTVAAVTSTNLDINTTVLGQNRCINGAATGGVAMTHATCTTSSPPPGTNQYTSKAVWLDGSARTRGITSDAVARSLMERLVLAAAASADSNNSTTGGWKTSVGGSGVSAATAYGIAFDNNGPIIKITSNTAFEVDMMDGIGNTGMTLCARTTRALADLPPICQDGFTTKIIGNVEADTDDYYMKFEAKVAGTLGVGQWVEAAAPGVTTTIDPTTMPHVLIRSQDDDAGSLTGVSGGLYFVFDYARQDFANPSAGEWATRNVGDDTSNSPPSFIGKTIDDVFFFQNRLGVLSDGSVCCSEIGRYTNFWRTTAVRIVDSDRIDVRNQAQSSTSHLRPTRARHAVAMNDRLMLFSENTIFELGGKPTLTPRTVSIVAVEEHPCSAVARPVVGSRAVYFAFRRSAGLFSGIQRLQPSEEATTAKSFDVTQQAPTYITGDPLSLTMSSSEGVVAMLTNEHGPIIYLLRILDPGDGNLRFGVSRFVFDGTAMQTKILGIVFVQSDLYALVWRERDLHLEVLRISDMDVDAGGKKSIRLDRQCSDETPGFQKVYNAGSNTTTITPPYLIPASDLAFVRVVNDSGSEHMGVPNGLLIPPASGPLVVAGDWTDKRIVLGFPYISVLEVQPPTVRLDDTGADLQFEIVLKAIVAYLSETGYLIFGWTPKGGSERLIPFTGGNVLMSKTGSTSPRLDSGVWSFPVSGRAFDTRVRFLSDSHLPFAISKIDWGGVARSDEKKV